MIPEWLSLIDVAVVAMALLVALGGLQKGFASQVAHIITFAAMGAFLFLAYPHIYNTMGRLFRSLDERSTIWLLLAGVVVLAVIFFVLVNKLLANILKMQISDKTDRVYGFILGFIRGGLAVLILMVFMVILGSEHIYTVLSEKSQVGRFVCRDLVPRIQPHISKKSGESGFDRMREALIKQNDAGVIE